MKRLVVVSGLSGSGKSVALKVFEDLNYYCIDNLPVSLLDKLTQDLLADGSTRGDKVAIGIDARNKPADLQKLSEQISRLKSRGTSAEVLFLQTADDVLLKRYGETRRKHPLATADMSLREAIARERVALAPVLVLADLIIDTTRTSVYELRDLVRERIAPREAHKLSILIESFGFKHGLPSDADYVFDVRCLPNPYWEPKLRQQTGLDQGVIAFFEQQPIVAEMHDSIIAFCRQWLPQFRNFNRSYLTIAIGCTGGQHRSVYMAERIARTLSDTDHATITVRHHELVASANPLHA
ncbi:MAG: RNase adapter RapZ [Pseudomonadota bacterium]